MSDEGMQEAQVMRDVTLAAEKWRRSRGGRLTPTQRDALQRDVLASGSARASALAERLRRSTRPTREQLAVLDRLVRECQALGHGRGADLPNGGPRTQSEALGLIASRAALLRSLMDADPRPWRML